MDLCFEVHKLAISSSNTGKVYFEGLIHLLRYIRYIKNLGLKYYSKIEYVTISDLLRLAIIKSEKKLMVVYDYIGKEFTDTDRSPGSYIVFYKGGPIYHCKHVPVPVSQYSSETEYNAACNAGMDLSHFRMINIELMNKDTCVVT